MKVRTGGGPGLGRQEFEWYECCCRSGGDHEENK